MATEVKVLLKGYLLKTKTGGVGWSTITLIKDDDKIIIVDPGTVKSQKLIVDALKKENLRVSDITHVFITHSHLDHYRNIGMFSDATVIDFWGEWKKDMMNLKKWSKQYSEKGNFSKNIQIVKTPGHDSSSVTFFVNGKIFFNGELVDGIIAICGDVFWKKNYPEVENEPFAIDKSILKKSRDLIIENADYVIPGHDDIYKVG